MAKNVLTYNLAEPLNDATTAKVDIDAGDGNTYQPPDFDGAAGRVEITVHNGAGNVSVATI